MTASTVNSMAVEVSQSDLGVSEPQFRFAAPKPFVGNRSTSMGMKRPAEAAPQLSFSRKRRGRPKRRALDGRADIRALPNYIGDPIEDIEEGDTSPSLFGALELS